MPSPFPGMDPYLEQDDVWHDFHEQFCHECRALLVSQLGPSYIAKIDEHIYIQETETAPRELVGRGDVTVVDRDVAVVAFESASDIAAPAICLVEPSIDIERRAVVEIRDRHHRELITVIELLSPSNKRPGRDREQYLRKRSEILISSTNLVELDLLCGGKPMPVTGLPECSYYALVSRRQSRPHAEVWPIGFRDPLPTIPIPLRPPDQDIRLDLRKALDQAFSSAGYSGYIYAQGLAIRISASDLAWSNALGATMR